MSVFALLLHITFDMRHFKCFNISLDSKCRMNSTLWNSTEEALGHFFLGGLIFLIFFYAIYLSYAIHDYQYEKPINDKNPIDIQFKDINCTTICLL